MSSRGFRFVLVALFAALVVVGAVFSIPLPPPLPPVTLAVFFALLSGMVLGPLGGLATSALYLGLGIVGMPVFANGSGGFGHLAGPTGGFILGYAGAASVAGLVADRKRYTFLRALAGGVAGVVALYAIGLPWFRAVLDARPDRDVSMVAAFIIMAPYLVGDLVKAFAAAALVKALAPLLGARLGA